MLAVLIRIDAQNAAGTPLVLRLASHDIPTLCHLDGEQWDAALAQLPDFALDFFGGSFAGQVTAPRTGFALVTSGISGFASSSTARARFADARVRIWAGDITSPVSADIGPLTLRFDGRLAGEPQIDELARVARFEAAVKDSWADNPLLELFGGTGGVEGPADLSGQPKPLTLGNVRFAKGVLIDNVDNVYMVSSGAIQGVSAVYDRVASLGASSGNHASLAALLGANIPNGSWATCLALGLVRLGAPPDGRVSFDVQGDNGGSGGYVRRAGAIIRRIAEVAGGTVDTASMAALDAARPYNLQLQLTDQVTPREIIARIADSVCAVAGVSLTGDLFAQPLAIGSASEALNADGSSALPVLAVEEQPKAVPAWRLATEAELTFEVHSADEAAFGYRWQGEYSASRVYRLDDVVTSEDGASWAYINASPAAGQALPVWPTTSNSHWQNFSPPVNPSAIGLQPGATSGGNLVSIADHSKIPANWTGLNSLSTDVPSVAPAGSRSYVWSDGARQTSPIIAGSALARKFFVSGWMSTLGHTGGPVAFIPRGASDGAIIGRAGLSGDLTMPANTDWTYLSGVIEVTDNVSGIVPGLDLSANGGASPKVWGMTWIELVPGIETITSPSNFNRVPFSRMEGGRGWLSFGSMAVATAVRPVAATDSGRVFIRADHTASASGQSFAMRNSNETSLPVFPGERLSASALISVSNSSSWRLDLEFYDDDDILVDAERLGGIGTGTVNNQKFSKFVTVPPGAVKARFYLLVVSNGAGPFWAHIADPMVSSAAPGQTAHPNFVPGPNADDAADVTANAQVLASQPTAFEIQADSAGVTTSNLATIERTIAITKGGVGQTSGVTVGTVTRSPSSEITVATPTVSGGIVTVKLTKADAAGSITVPVIFEGKTYRVTIDVRRTLAAPSPGSTNDSYTDQTWANVSGTTFAQIAGDGNCESNGSGIVRIRYAASYTGGRARCKVQYRPESGGSWIDVPGSDRTGSTPIPPTGWPEPEPGEPGTISYGFANLTGLSANTMYRFRLLALSVSGGLVSWSSPVFTVEEP